MRAVQATILSASDASNQTSSVVDSNQLFSASFLASFGSDVTGAGTIQIQGSNDPTNVGNLAIDAVITNWVNVPGATATATVTAGAAVYVYVPQGFMSRWLRVVFTRSAGAGTITINLFGQSV